MSLELDLELREIISQHNLGIITRYYAPVSISPIDNIGLLLEDDDPPMIESEPEFL